MFSAFSRALFAPNYFNNCSWPAAGAFFSRKKLASVRACRCGWVQIWWNSNGLALAEFSLGGMQPWRASANVALGGLRPGGIRPNVTVAAFGDVRVTFGVTFATIGVTFAVTFATFGVTFAMRTSLC